MREQTPCYKLREKTGLNVLDFAAESGICRPSVYKMEEGRGISYEVAKALNTRWPREMRRLRLTVIDFLEGKVTRKPRRRSA